MFHDHAKCTGKSVQNPPKLPLENPPNESSQKNPRDSLVVSLLEGTRFETIRDAI
jgi:hypothetical protein